MKQQQKHQNSKAERQTLLRTIRPVQIFCAMSTNHASVKAHGKQENNYILFPLLLLWLLPHHNFKCWTFLALPLVSVRNELTNHDFVGQGFKLAWDGGEREVRVAAGLNPEYEAVLSNDVHPGGIVVLFSSGSRKECFSCGAVWKDLQVSSANKSVYLCQRSCRGKWKCVWKYKSPHGWVSNFHAYLECNQPRILRPSHGCWRKQPARRSLRARDEPQGRFRWCCLVLPVVKQFVFSDIYVWNSDKLSVNSTLGLVLLTTRLPLFHVTQNLVSASQSRIFSVSTIVPVSAKNTSHIKS